MSWVRVSNSADSTPFQIVVSLDPAANNSELDSKELFSPDPCVEEGIGVVVGIGEIGIRVGVGVRSLACEERGEGISRRPKP
jgi:hypothetical protein